MNYITYKRFRGRGIGGEFNLPYNTLVREKNGILYHEGRAICTVTSENGWEHFRPNTPEGAARQTMLDALCKIYLRDKNGNKFSEDFAERIATETRNTYWKNIVRTSSTEKLREIYRKRIKGAVKCIE